MTLSLRLQGLGKRLALKFPCIWINARAWKKSKLLIAYRGLQLDCNESLPKLLTHESLGLRQLLIETIAVAITWHSVNNAL